MANHFYLPQLTDANLSTPNEHGHWFNNEKKVILGISDAILIDESALTKGVSSIPDIWARPLLFQSAIKKESKHPLKKKCIQEWRGLMSLIALHDAIPGLSLEFVPIALDNERLCTALKNLKPDPIQLEKDKFYEWTDILMIRYNQIPLGAFSPTTLVFTGTDYNKRLPKEYPLKDEEGYLKPPMNSLEGLEIVGEWLINLKAKFQNIFFTSQENPHHLIISNINSLIEDWLIEIRDTLNLSENEEINAKKFKVSDEMVEIVKPAHFLNEYSIYKLMLHSMVKDSTGTDDFVSDVELATKRNLNGFKHVILINQKLLEKDIYLWEEMRSKPLGENPLAIIEKHFNKPFGTSINGYSLGQNEGMWIRPELYFLSDELLKAKNGDILTVSEEDLNKGTRYILPFTDKILDFFSPKDIKDILNPVYKEENGFVKFSFSIPLVNGQRCIVDKIYRSKNPQSNEGKISEVEVPIVEIFPNYLGNNWRRYYLFQGQANEFSFKPQFAGKIVHTEITKREAKYLQNDESLEIISTMKIQDKSIGYSSFNQDVAVTQISGDDSFPEALSALKSNGDQIGLILLEKSFNNIGLQHEWTIGIDFGTSNTNVFKKTGVEDPAEKWIFNFPEYMRSITLSTPLLKKVILQEHFFPTKKVELPIPSTLKMYNLAIRENLVLDYSIYFPSEYKYPQNVLCNIKWDVEGERNTEYFLQSLLFLLLIEVVQNNVAKVKLACSFPKAFSGDNRTTFEQEWNKTYEKLLSPNANNSKYVMFMHQDTVEDNNIKASISPPCYETEGIAAGEYFANKLTIPSISERANKELAVICLDIGGGTTDISIWYENFIEFDASILLAGRQISDLIQRNARVRELLFSKEAAIALEEKKNEPVYFSARLNLILKNEENIIHENLVRHATNKDIKWLRQIIAIEFGAISFYAAEVCVSTNEIVGGLLSRISDAGINLHWGGNAAKLINWIDFGKYSREGIASKILNASFYKCLDDKSLAEKSIKPANLLQIQSPGHKSEASGGLVVMDLDDKVISKDHGSAKLKNEMDEMDEFENAENIKHNNFTGIVCGEDIILSDGSKVLFYEPISNKNLFDENNKTKFKSTSLERFNRFIEVINFFGIKYGLFSEDSKIILTDKDRLMIKDGVMKEFIRMQSKNDTKRLIEPIFIMEIKLLLDIIKDKMN